MHVEIDDGRALGAVTLLRVARRDGDIVEQAEAHRPRRLGVMAGRADGDKGIRCLLVHHFVHRQHAAADAAQRRLEAARRHRGVGVELHQAFLGRGVADRLHVFHRMHQRDGLERRARRLDARQRLEALVLKRLLDGTQPVGALGMAERRLVIEAGGMGDEQRGHGGRRITEKVDLS